MWAPQLLLNFRACYSTFKVLSFNIRKRNLLTLTLLLTLDSPKTAPYSYHFRSIQAEEVKHRSCGAITTFITGCMPILTQCLSTSTAEIIRAKDATWLVNLALSEIKNKSFKFHHTECEVLGGKISSSTFLNQEQYCKNALKSAKIFVYLNHR